MKVIRARILGFCMGVRRAVEIAETAAKSAGKLSGRVYTLGPLIHNPEALETLKSRGVEILDETKLPDDLSGASVIIRAHGVSPSVEAELARRGALVIDATCPYVKASQTKAHILSGVGAVIFLAGEKKHAEIIGILGYVNGPCFVVANPGEAAAAALAAAGTRPLPRAALIGQTTITAEEYGAIGQEIRNYFPALETINTICGATRDRQDALRELGGKADAFIVSGGRDSANTRRLLSIAESLGKKAWLAENAKSLPPEVFSCDVVGLSAGASTPDETIDEIERCLLKNARP